MLASAEELRNWLDKAKGRAAAARRARAAEVPASQAQIDALQKLIESGRIEAPESWPNISKAVASMLFDNASGGSKGVRPRPQGDGAQAHGEARQMRMLARSPTECIPHDPQATPLVWVRCAVPLCTEEVMTPVSGVSLPRWGGLLDRDSGEVICWRCWPASLLRSAPAMQG